MTQLDEFTLDLLTNDEVLDVNQDPLGKQGRRVTADRTDERSGPASWRTAPWPWPLQPRGGSDPSRARFADLGLTGSQAVRDLWAKKDLGRFAEGWGATVPRHGALLLKVGESKNQE